MNTRKTLASIKGIKINCEGYMLGDFLLTNDENLVSEESLGFPPLLAYGLVGKYEFSQGIYFLYKSSNISQDVNKELKEANIESYIYLSIVNTFLLLLWFVKDSSAYLNNIYSINHFVENEKYMLDPLRRNCDLLTTNSAGIHTITEFSAEELDEAQAFGKLLEPLISQDIEEIREEYDSKTNNRVTSSFAFNHGSKNIIARAIDFLIQARSTDNIILKLSNHIMIYECLFSISSSEVSHKVSENIALFMGNNTQERKDVFSLIKKVYNIRSSYVHGAEVKEPNNRKIIKIETLINLSFEIDNLSRNILKKILTSHLNNFFDPTSKIDPRIEYFRDLLFERDSFLS